MTGHHRVGAHINGEHLGQLEDPGPNPVSPMDEIPSGLDINASNKLAPHASRDDVVMRCGVQRNKLAAGHRHGGSTQFGPANQPSGCAAAGL